MHVKTFEGLTVSDAMKAVKKSLGADAVILSTKEKSLGKVKTVEVKAASSSSQRYFQEKNDSEKKIDDEKIQYRLDRLEYLGEKILEKSHHDFFYEKIFDHMREIKMILSSDFLKKEHLDVDINDQFLPVYQTLLVNGVQKEFLLDLVKHIKEVEKTTKKEDFSSLEDFYRSLSINWMLKKIKIHNFGKSSVHLFLGPTGSGKTTFIQKLASVYKQKNIPFILLSYDNIKVGGHESLKIYGKILGEECKYAESSKDLHNLILENRNKSILIDTVGTNPKGFSDIEELKSLKTLDIPMETHLVLSLLEKSHQLDRAIHYFGKIGLDSLILTKLDGSLAFGDLFNLAAHWSMPLSFFSTSQKVPDGLEKASKERVIEKIFGL